MEDQVYQRHINNFLKHWWFQGRKKIIENSINALNIKKKNKILDFGSGSGVNLNMLSKFGSVDIYEPHVQTKKFLKLRYNKKGFRIINSFKDNKYDLIILADVLEHIKNDKIEIKKIYKYLKKNGKILITVPAFPFLFTKKDEVLKHFRRYRMKEIKNIFSKFETIKLTYFNFFLFIPISMILMFTKIFNINFIDKVEKKPTKFINPILYSILCLESILIKFINLPFGISILGVFKKND